MKLSREKKFSVNLLKAFHYNPQSPTSTKWSNALIQFVGCSRQIVWACFTILWGWRFKDCDFTAIRNAASRSKKFVYGFPFLLRYISQHPERKVPGKHFNKGKTWGTYEKEAWKQMDLQLWEVLWYNLSKPSTQITWTYSLCYWGYNEGLFSLPSAILLFCHRLM